MDDMGLNIVRTIGAVAVIAWLVTVGAGVWLFVLVARTLMKYIGG